MVSNRFKWHIVWRVGILFISLCVFSWLIFRPGHNNLLFTEGIVVVLIGLQVWSLVRWLGQVNRKAIRFFEALNSGEFNLSFMQHQNGSLDDLIVEFNRYLKVQLDRNTGYGSEIGFLRLLIDQVSTGMVCWGKDSVMKFQNPAASTLLAVAGYDTWTDFLADNEMLTNGLQQRDSARKYLLKKTQKGQARHIKLELKPVLLRQEELWLCSLEDITTEILEKENQAWHQLMRTLSHEIRNAITPIRSLAYTVGELIRDSEEQVKTPENLSYNNMMDIDRSIAVIQERSEQLNAFTTNVLKLERIPSPVPVRITIEALFQRTIDLFTADFEKNKVQVDVQLESSDLSVLADPAQLDMMLANLITNSLHALSPVTDRQISLRSYQEHSGLCIEIGDNGVGIPEEDVEQVFLPFFSTRKGGAGLGLAIVGQMIQKHHGRVSFTSGEEEKTRFCLWFPSE